MRHRFKGFTLVELMVTVAVLLIVVTIAIPGFSALTSRQRADTETGDFYRALNYARLEAINRGKNVRVVPASGTAWAGVLNVQVGTETPVLRVVPAMATSSSLTPSVSGLAAIDFNNLGAPSNLTSALTLTYVNGSTTRTILVCLNGRVVRNGSCT